MLADTNKFKNVNTFIRSLKILTEGITITTDTYFLDLSLFKINDVKTKASSSTYSDLFNKHTLLEGKA